MKADFSFNHLLNLQHSLLIRYPDFLLPKPYFPFCHFFVSNQRFRYSALKADAELSFNQQILNDIK